MDNEKSHYLVVLKDGSEHSYKTLEEIVEQVSEDLMECILAADYKRTFKGPSNTTDWYHYRIVALDGTPSTYKIGDFEVVFIGEDRGCTNFFGRDITIKMITTGEFFKYKSEIECGFIKQEIEPLLVALNKMSSIDEVRAFFAKKGFVSYDQLSQENKNLKEVITQIRKLLSRFDEKI